MSSLAVRVDATLWEIPASARPDMRVPARIFADADLYEAIAGDDSLEQLQNVATLPGIVEAALAMPDVHQVYGFPVGGVAAIALPDGVVSPGGVGYDVNCGVSPARAAVHGSRAGAAARAARARALARDSRRRRTRAGRFERAAGGACTSSRTAIPAREDMSSIEATDAIRRIVVGYDGSDPARRALARVAEIASPSTSVGIVTVAPAIVSDVRIGPIIDPSDSEERDRLLAEGRTVLGQYGVAAATLRRQGDVAAGILDAVEAAGADLVVVGTRGRGPLKSALLGSVSSAVVTRAPCDVLIIR